MTTNTQAIATHNAAIERVKFEKQSAREYYMDAGKQHCRENRLSWKSIRRQLKDVFRAPSLREELAEYKW